MVQSLVDREEIARAASRAGRSPSPGGAGSEAWEQDRREAERARLEATPPLPPASVFVV